MFLELGEFVQKKYPIMSKRDLAGFRGIAPADQSDVGYCVVWRPERSLRDKRPLPIEQPHDAVDLSGLDGLGKGHLRQNGRQPPGEHGLARPRRAEHQEIMCSGSSYFQRPFCILLPPDLGKILMVLGFQPKKLMDINLMRNYGYLSVQEPDDLGQIGNPDNVGPLDDPGFIYILDRDYYPFPFFRFCRDRNRERTAHPLYRTVQRKLADYQIVGKLALPDHASGSQDADCDRKIERGPFLLEIGRCQIHRYPAGRELVTRILQCRLDPVLALLDRPVRQPDSGKLRQP